MDLRGKPRAGGTEMIEKTKSAAWLELPASLASNGGEANLAAELEKRVQERLASGEYTSQELDHVSRVDVNPIQGELNIPDKRLEKLRRLCQVWDVDLRVDKITSHRKIIGPFIVAAKKLMLPVIRVFLKNFIAEQREFNAAAVSLLAELSNRKEGQGGSGAKA